MMMDTAKNNNLMRLLVFAGLLLFFGLGARELWSLETRWATICLQMIQSQDYFHPYLKGETYYDKPLLSYWLIILSSKILGSLSTTALRLPSALAALASLYFTYAIGSRIYTKQTGLLAAWLLATTFYFIFWGRVASADMLNLAGILAAVWWFFRNPEDTSFINYFIFFQIIAITCLCKGLLGIVLPGLILFPYLTLHHLWRKHLNLNFFLAILPAILVYFIPFWLSQTGSVEYQSNGLSLVMRENITRFVAPFDHKNPFYTYLIYLPVYTLPWTPLFLIALVQFLRQWKQQTLNTRWLIITIVILFSFFTLSGSRRSYYVLPLVPFAQLLAAKLVSDWTTAERKDYLKWLRVSGLVIAISLALFFGVVLPWYYSGGGLPMFGEKIREQAQTQAPWEKWHSILINIDNKVPFYVQTSMPFTFLTNPKVETTKENLLAALELSLPLHQTIIIMPESELALFQPYLGNYQLIETTPTNGERIFSKKIKRTVALVPKKLLP